VTHLNHDNRPADRASDSTREYFDQVSGGWSERYRNRRFRDRLKNGLELLPEDPRGLTLLDYGCGSGVLTAALVQRGCHVTAVDPSAGMIRAAEAYLAEQCPRSDRRYRLERITGQDTPDEAYRQVDYNGVYCLGVLEYVADDQELLERLVCLLKPGGFLVLSVPNAGSVLRRVEGFVFRHPTWFFRWLGLLDHVTGPDSYLHHQKHQYRLADLDRRLLKQQAIRTAARFRVAPSLLGLERCSRVGMTMMVRYETRDRR